MIPLPTKGFRRSVEAHNVDLDVLTDWIEASVLLEDQGVVYAAEVVDLFVDEEIYAKQDFCWVRINDAFTELRRRANLGPACPFRIVDKRVERVGASWKNTPAQLFLLLLSLSHNYDKWRRTMPIDYNVQGELFECLTRESLLLQFPGWSIDQTGWSRAKPTKLADLVVEIAAKLGEVQGEVVKWVGPAAHEAGLDLLCYRPFADCFVGVPLLMMQCASGHWDEPGKLKTPDLDIWMKIVQFASKPKKAFATPFSFDQTRFRQIAVQVNGVLMDRYRILTFEKHEADWLPQTLRSGLSTWVGDRIAKLDGLAN